MFFPVISGLGGGSPFLLKMSYIYGVTRRKRTVRFSLYIVFCALWLALPAMARDVPDTSLVEGPFEHNSESVPRRPEPVVEQEVIDGKEIEIRKYVLKASQQAFLNMDTSFKASMLWGWNEDGVSKYPIETVVDFYRCTSSADSWPKCHIEFLDKDENAIMTSDISVSGVQNRSKNLKTCNDEGGNCVEEIDNMSRNQQRDWIKSRLGMQMDSVKSIHMYKDEKMDLLWGLFGGLFGAEISALVAMVAEFPISYAMDKPYDWKDVGWITLAGFVGFTTYSVVHIAVTRKTTRMDVTIKF